MFTASEKESRYKALRQALDADNLNAIILIGDTRVGPEFNGDLRYFTDYPVIFDWHVVVAFSDSKTSHVSNRQRTAKEGAVQKPFVDDCRGSNHFVADVAHLLMERGVVTGRIGVSFEMLPAAWYLYLKRKLPQVEWVEIHQRLMQIRFQRSQKNLTFTARGLLGRWQFEAAVKFIRPGVNEHEIVAEIEHHARAGS